MVRYWWWEMLQVVCMPSKVRLVVYFGKSIVCITRSPLNGCVSIGQRLVTGGQDGFLSVRNMQDGKRSKLI